MLLDFQKRAQSPCLLCGSCEFILLNSNDRYLMGLKTVGCLNCGLLQTNPRPNKSDLSEFYLRDYRRFYQGIENPDAAYVQDQKKQERLQNTYDYLKSFKAVDIKSRILDVGCSEGTFFNVLRKNGCVGNFCGVEPGITFAQYTMQIPNTQVFSSIDKIVGQFELVSMIHVLEHESNPLVMLTSLKKLLSMSGFLYIDVPDAESYRNIDSLHIAHIVHFTKRTLADIIVRAGFKIIHLETYFPINHPPSIRLLATSEQNLVGSAQAMASKKTEAPTWQRIKGFTDYAKRLRHYLDRFPMIKNFYRSCKNFIHSAK